MVLPGADGVHHHPGIGKSANVIEPQRRCAVTNSSRRVGGRRQIRFRRNIFHRRIKMAFDDLRSFLQALDEQGQLLKIEEEVNAEPDLAAVIEPQRRRAIANAPGSVGGRR